MTFDHLDDPEGFLPDDDFATAAKRRGAQLRRRRRIPIAGLGAVLVVLMLGVGFGLYERNKASNIYRLDLTASLDDPHAGSTDPVVGDADAPPTDVINVLVVGSDARIPGADRPPDENLTDTMMIVHIDPPAHQVRVLSLPRDLWVAIPGHGNDRLNTAWATGGPALLIDTIKANYNIPIHHYLGVDGTGFRQLVDQAGGANVYVAGRLDDSNTGFTSSGAGCVHLDGATTLALVRSRHLTFLTPDNRRHEDPSSDLGRIQRQQLVARTMAASLLQRAPTPAAADELLDTLVSGAILDSTWSLRDMARILNWGRSLDLGRDLVMSSPPTTPAYEGKAAVLHLDAAAAEAVFIPFRSTPSSSTSISTTTIAPTTGANPSTATTTATPSTLAPGVPPVEQWVTGAQPDGTPCA
jgi:LCP family protein required for cell wall assembly